MIQKGAVATSLVAIVLRVLCISFKKHENGFILWKVAIPDGMASGVRGWLAAYFMKDLHDVIFAKILVTLIIVSGIQIWVESIKKKRLSKSSDAAFSAADKKN